MQVYTYIYTTHLEKSRPKEECFVTSMCLLILFVHTSQQVKGYIATNIVSIGYITGVPR